LIFLFEIGGFAFDFLDIMDILIVGYLFYLIYNLLKGTIAFNIFIGALLFYGIYWIVSYLGMNLLSTLLGKFVGYGVLILIIIFTPELRKILLMFGETTLKGRLTFLNSIFKDDKEIETTEATIISKKISEAVMHLSNTKTGALLILSLNELSEITNTGHKLDAQINTLLLENIFFKNSPLHDGAVILSLDKIVAAGCILPVSTNNKLASDLGLRHRAAVGATERYDVLSLIVSEETGDLSFSKKGKIRRGVNKSDIEAEIIKYFTKT